MNVTEAAEVAVKKKGKNWTKKYIHIRVLFLGTD